MTKLICPMCDKYHTYENLEWPKLVNNIIESHLPIVFLPVISACKQL